jgi:hypothetical protein
MKELRATVSDEEFAELEHLAQVLGVRWKSCSCGVSPPI